MFKNKTKVTKNVKPTLEQLEEKISLSDVWITYPIVTVAIPTPPDDFYA